MKYLLVLLFLSTAALAVDKPAQPIQPIYKPQVVGWVYSKFCNDVLKGDWVNDNPSFYQAWSCQDGNWCNVYPEVYGCRLK